MARAWRNPPTKCGAARFLHLDNYTRAHVASTFSWWVFTYNHSFHSCLRSTTTLHCSRLVCSPRKETGNFGSLFRRRRSNAPGFYLLSDHNRKYYYLGKMFWITIFFSKCTNQIKPTNQNLIRSALRWLLKGKKQFSTFLFYNFSFLNYPVGKFSQM